MKLFKKETWGTVLIVIGMVLFLFIIYDTVRPYFPRKTPYPYLKYLQDAFQSVTGIFTSDPDAAPVSSSKSRSHQPRPVNQPRSSGQFPISSTIKTQGKQQIWIWEILPDFKTGKKVKLEIAHAAPGKEGGFFMVAYADTNNDKKPDKEIAKSPFFTAEETGDWSVWEFETEEKRIFVGNTWPPENNTIVFRASGNWPGKQFPLKGRFYHQIHPDSQERTQSAGPAYTNLKVSFPD